MTATNLKRTVLKQNRATKVCPVCQRPFQWRRKWARDWPTVIYCSERCRRSKSQSSP